VEFGAKNRLPSCQSIAAVGTERKVLVTIKQSKPHNPLRVCRQGLEAFSRPGFIKSSFRLYRLAILTAFFVVPFAVGLADAAFVTLKESEMDDIFGQASFGANPIDVRYLPTITHNDPNLLNIDTSSKRIALFNLFSSSSVHFAYYVDSVDWCGSFNTGIVGCGDQPGDDYVIESGYASGSNGAELMGHELAHNLALAHHPAPVNDNLMDAVVGSAPGPPATTTLTVAQANVILGRPSIKTDVSGKYVEVQPVLIIPEPTTLVLALGFLSASMLGYKRRLH
jgi:hypothetical protein